MNCARKHTLVTGCSSGIGRSTVLRLARDGQHVYAGVRKPADGDALARSAAGEGGEITPVILDVTEPGHIAAAAAAIDEHTGSSGYQQTHGYRFLSSIREMTYSACVGVVRLDIGQLADVAGWPPGQDERVEVRIALDALDPPAGPQAAAPDTEES